MAFDNVNTIKDGKVECSRQRTSEHATFALHYHAGSGKSYITRPVGGEWSEVPMDELFNLVDLGYTDGVLVNKIASLIDGRSV